MEHLEKPVGVVQAAEYLGVSRDWVYRRSAEGTLPCHKVGRISKFYISELQTWLKSQGGSGAANAR